MIFKRCRSLTIKDILVRKKADNKKIWPLWRISLVGLILFALGMSVLLSWHFLTGETMAGCGGGSPCDQVLSSKWSMIAGIVSVSGLAMGVYLAMLFAVFFIGADAEKSVRYLAWKVLLLLAGSVTGGATWFIILQKWVIGEFCFYCMTTHITGLVISALICWQAMREPGFHSAEKTGETDMKTDVEGLKHVSRKKRLQVTGLVFAGLVFAGILAAGQVGLAPTSVYHNGASQEKLPEVDYNNVPLIGSVDAPVIVILLFDYQCAHCQKIHFMLYDVVNRYKGKLAFALCPTPLNTQCNRYIPRDMDAFKNSCELAKTGLAVWKANHEAFPAFENWMFTYDSGDRWRPRSLEIARAKAIELVGQPEFETALTDPWIESYLKSCVGFFGQTLQNGKGGIPKLIYGSRWVIPEPENTEDLIRILQESLTLPQP